MKSKAGFSALRVGVVSMSLLLATIAAQAATVEREGDTATAIRDLVVDGTPYDVVFVSSSANNLYGDPPVFDFDTAEKARAAVDAVTEALTAAGDIFEVGEPDGGPSRQTFRTMFLR